MTEPRQITVANHWVPQWYLRRWSLDGKTIATYEVLVPHAKYPVWNQRSIRSQAVADHLYTTTNNPEEPDVFERFLKNEIEEPAIAALEKAERADSLTIEEHDRITRYAVALDQRTPASYFEHLKKAKEYLPQSMQKTMGDSVAEMERARKRNRPPRPTRKSILDQEMIMKLPLTVKVCRFSKDRDTLTGCFSKPFPT